MYTDRQEVLKKREKHKYQLHNIDMIQNSNLAELEQCEYPTN